MGTADQATNDVEKLHAKVDRTRDTEAGNTSNSHMFQQRYCDNLDQMESSLCSYVEGHEELTGSVCRNLSGYIMIIE